MKGHETLNFVNNGQGKMMASAVMLKQMTKENGQKWKCFHIYSSCVNKIDDGKELVSVRR